MPPEVRGVEPLVPAVPALLVPMAPPVVVVPPPLVVDADVEAAAEEEVLLALVLPPPLEAVLGLPASISWVPLPDAQATNVNPHAASSARTAFSHSTFGYRSTGGPAVGEA